MAKKPDVPCARCGKMLWSGPRSKPAGERLCRVCQHAPPTDEPSAPPWAPGGGLGPRGRALWRDLKGATLPAGDRVLLEEACRLADRCDQLDDFLRGVGDAWLKFRDRSDDGSTVEVVIDKALSEARQHASTLKTLLVELRPKAEAPSGEASRLDDLAKRREDRRRAAGL